MGGGLPWELGTATYRDIPPSLTQTTYAAPNWSQKDSMDVDSDDRALLPTVEDSPAYHTGWHSARRAAAFLFDMICGLVNLCQQRRSRWRESRGMKVVSTLGDFCRPLNRSCLFFLPTTNVGSLEILIEIAEVPFRY